MDIAQRVDTIKRFLDARGILWKSSRIDRLLTNLSSPEFCGPFDERQADRLLAAQHALRDLDELYEIATHATDAPKADLKTLVHDHEIMRRDGESKGRNKQLELFTLATFRKGGAHARLEEPPDVIAELDGVCIGVACKRLRKELALNDRLVEAVDQLGRSGLWYGIAILDVSVAFNPEYSWIQTTKPDHAIGDELMARLHRKLDPFDRVINLAFTKSSKLIGLLWLDTVFVDAGEGFFPHRTTLFSLRDTLPTSSSVSHRLIRAIQKRWTAGLDGVTFVDQRWIERTSASMVKEALGITRPDRIIRMRPLDKGQSDL